MADYFEKYKYFTDEFKVDTDDDGINDGDEVFNVIMSVSENEKDIKVEPSITMDLQGKNIGSVTISNIGQSNPYLQSSTPGYIGAPYGFYAPMNFISRSKSFLNIYIA